MVDCGNKMLLLLLVLSSDDDQGVTFTEQTFISYIMESTPTRSTCILTRASSETKSHCLTDEERRQEQQQHLSFW